MVKESDSNVEVNSTYLDWILEAVHKIKHQKQRPNKERIINAIRQNHQVTEDSIVEQLELSVQSGKLLRVENNNDYTYKDPALISQGKSLPPSKSASPGKSMSPGKPLAQGKTKQSDSKDDLMKLVVQCLKQSHDPKGLMLRSIEKYVNSKLKNKDEGKLISNLRTFIRRAVQQGQLKQVGKMIKLPTTEDRKGNNQPSLGLGDSNVEIVLPFERNRKKATPLVLCSFCLEGADSNREGKWEDLISCADCGNSGHPSCLKFSEELTAKVRKLRWQCINCKKCSFCGKSGKEDDMLFCDFCDRGFHMSCCDPPISKPPKGDWKCNLCDPERGNKKGKQFLEAAMKYTLKIKSQIHATSKQKLKKARLFQAAKQNKMRSSNKKKKRKSESADEDSSEDNETMKTDLLSPSEFTLNQGTLEALSVLPETKHLVDGLSHFFTPSNKRSSRVSLCAIQPPLIGMGEEIVKKKSKNKLTNRKDVKKSRNSQRSTQKTACRLIKRSKLVHASRVRKKSGAPPLSGQLRGLFDGLSQFFNATGERKRTLPVYNCKKETSLSSSSASFPLSSCTQHSCDSKGLNVCISDRQGSESILSSSRRQLSWWDEMNHLMQMTLQEFRHYGSQLLDGHNRCWAGRRTCIAQGRGNNSHLFRDTIRTKAGMVLPSYVTEEDVALFKQAQEQSQKELDKQCTQEANGLECKVETGRYPPCIEMGQYEIETWYSSPYPQEYASLPKLYICEYCLKYMKSRNGLHRHIEKCQLRHPPADEIYRCGELSVFEVDGQSSKLYCQNLCLLAKLFLDHKTLYYDVEPFLFYVLTVNDEYGSHVVGYFSKEKHCQQKYNVSCIMTMPQYMRKGYGRLLIDFSYLLSRREECFGSPEKPLSALGAVSYKAYWRSVLLEQFKQSQTKITIKSISERTGICPLDVLQTLKDLKFLKQQGEKPVIAVDHSMVEAYVEKVKAKPHLTLDEDSLHWTPIISKSFLTEEEEEADKQLVEMRHVVESIVTERKKISEELKKTPIKDEAKIASLCSPSTPEEDQTDKWPRRFGRKRFPSMTWGNSALKRFKNDGDPKCPFEFEADEDMPPPPQLRMEKSPARTSSPLSPISPSPFRPSFDSPVKTPDKKWPRKAEEVVRKVQGKKKMRRKPGRPPKMDGVSSVQKIKNKLGRKPGRPSLKDNRKERPLSKQGRPFKRKPGRPPKKADEMEDSVVKNSEDDVKNNKVPGRKPGRPRKNMTKSSGQAEEEAASHNESDEEVEENKKEETLSQDNDFLPSHSTVTTSPKSNKVIDEYIDSSSTSDSSDSSNSDTSDSDDDDDDDDDDNDGDNDDSEDEEKTKPKVVESGKPIENNNSITEMTNKVRRLSASSSDDSDAIPRVSAVIRHSVEKLSDDDSGHERRVTTQMFSDSDSQDQAQATVEKKEEPAKEEEKSPVDVREEREEDEETKAASENLAEIVKDLEQADSPQASVESSSFGSIDELTDAFSDAQSPSDPLIPSSPPPAPAPVIVNSDDEDLPSPAGSMGRAPTPQNVNLQSDSQVGRQSVDPLLSSPSHMHQPIQQVTLMSPAVQQSMMSPSVQHSSMMSPSIPQQTLMSPSIPQQTLMSPSIPQQTLMSPSIPQQTLMSPSIPQQTLRSPSVPQQTLMSPAAQNKNVTGMFPGSPILISASPEVKQQPRTPSQQIPTSSPYDDPYHSVASLASPAQLTSPGQLTSPSPSHLSSPAMSGHQEKHTMDTSPQQKTHSSMGMTRQNKSASARSQQRSRSSGQGRVTQTYLPSVSTGANVQSLQQHQANFDVSQLAADMASEPSQHSSLTLNYDCAQNMQYCNNGQSRNSFMDTVNMGGLHAHSSGSGYLSQSVATTSINYHHHGSPISTYPPSLQQQQRTQQSLHQNSPRIIPMVVQQAMLQGSNVYQTQQPNNCDLIKLQQLTNRIHDMPVDNLPAQNLTPPPPSSINMTPPPTVMMRSMTPVPPHTALMGQPSAPVYKRQRTSSSTSRKAPTVSQSNPNVTINPNMTLTPNVTIQPGTGGMIPRYFPYRMPQGMINPSYITANSQSFLQPQQIPMQMMNVSPQTAFQQQTGQPGNPTTVYTPYYINMNNVMRR